MRKKVFYSVIVMALLCFCLLRTFGNPIPLPTLIMPEEWISVSINERDDILPGNDNSLEASVDGLYPMRNLKYEKVRILDPVPPRSYDIRITLDGNPLKWTWSDMFYGTVLPEWPRIPQLEWTIAPVPEKFDLTAHYKHGLVYRENEIVFFYPMGCWDGQPIYSPSMTAHIKTRLPGRYLPKGVFLDHDPAPFTLSLDPDVYSPVPGWVVGGDYQSKPFRALERDYILTIMDRWGDPAAWFSQPPDMATGFALPSMDTINTPVPADDFILPASSFVKENVGNVRFWGTYPGWRTNIAHMNNADIKPPCPKYIRIRIYDSIPDTSDNTPRPDSLVYEYRTETYNQKFFGSVVKETTESDDTADAGWSYHHVFSYDISLPRPFIPVPGQRYWISISSGPVDENVIWSWVISPVNDFIPGIYMSNDSLTDNAAVMPRHLNLSFVLSTTPDVVNNGVSYRLVDGSTITVDYPNMERPTIRLPIDGSFLLTQTLSSASGYRTFTVTNLSFMPKNGDEHTSGKNGKGKYLLDNTTVDPARQQMSVSINIGGNLPVRLDSGSVGVPEDIDFPWIDITVKNNGTSIGSVSPQYAVHLVAVPMPGFSFSTDYPFTSGSLGNHVSDGDLLSSKGTILLTNSELISAFNLYPTFAEQKVGLDAVIGPINHFSSEDGSMVTPYVLFSSKTDILAKENPGHGDILNNFGRVVRRNIDLISPFGPMPVAQDTGLDALAVSRSPVTDEGSADILSEAAEIPPEKRIIVFSIKEGFFSEKLGVYIGPGDILTTDGRIYKTGKDLLRNFNPLSVSIEGSIDIDAVYILSNGEIWFSTASGFRDAKLGYVGFGDLLSENGRIILRNRDIVAPFNPIEDLADFGLDGISVLQ
ncbi:MAG: hypothetical protein JW881_07490 [Spirochaetales bacterium]|nr:hypothetical protein [Spirochaetales bacterium]